MIARGMAFVLLAVAFAPALLHAQYQIKVVGATYEVVPNRDKMYEDIEILRRILDRKLQGLHQQKETSAATGIDTWLLPQVDPNIGLLNPAGGVSNTPYWNPSSTKPNQTNEIFTIYNAYRGDAYWYRVPANQEMRPTIEGVYLKGQGIVFTATVPSLQLTSKVETAKPLSEWESVRRQIRNEKAEAQKPEANKPPSVRDVLLRVLAENGHHFSYLGENESLTLVLTVHGPRQTAPAPKSGGSGSAKKSSTTQALGGGSDLQDKVRDLVLLGNLHMKQGHYAEAIATYQKTVELKPGSNELVTLYRNLAQCYLNLGEDAKGRALLDQAISLRKKAEEKNDKTEPSKQVAVSLPVKLIISTPKKLLEEAKDGKLPFEEFRRRASVETLHFDGRH